MTQAYCELATFPFPRAGSIPAVISLDPITAIQCAERPLMRSERSPRCPLQAPHLACPHIPIASWQRCTHHQGRR